MTTSNLDYFIITASKYLEVIGVGLIIFGIFYHLIKYAINLFLSKKNTFKELKIQIGKVILLGLEILVAVDIVSTVTSKITFESVITLAIIVLIRTFLSLSIKIEIEGSLPWRMNK